MGIRKIISFGSDRFYFLHWGALSYLRRRGLLSRDFLLLALWDRVVSGVQEEADSDSTLYMSPAPEDLLFVAYPVNPLLSIHGGCRNRDSAFGDGVLADGTERLSWCIGGSGPGESGHPVADQLLAGCRGPGASP